MNWGLFSGGSVFKFRNILKDLLTNLLKQMNYLRRSQSIVSAALCGFYFMLFLYAGAQEGYIVMERHSKRVLLASDSERVVPVGSFAQLATAKLSLDWARLSKTPLSTMMVVPSGIAGSGVGNSLNLGTGDQISMRDALYAMSLRQDSACALVLGDFVGRKLLEKKGRGGNPYKAFTKEMNHLAGFLRMGSTRFKSPAGGLGKTKVSDLAKLAAYALETNGYDFYMKQKSRSVKVRRLSGVTQSLKLKNTNHLLGSMAIGGLMLEGRNAVIAANKKNVVVKLDGGRAKITPRQLIVVQFGSANRDARAKQLVTMGWQSYESWRAKGFPRSATGKEFLR